MSPRVLAQETIGEEVHLKVVFDPKTNSRYLSVGVGRKTIRRVWLSEEDATALLKKALELTIMLWSK